MRARHAGLDALDLQPVTGPVGIKTADAGNDYGLSESPSKAAVPLWSLSYPPVMKELTAVHPHH